MGLHRDTKLALAVVVMTVGFDAALVTLNQKSDTTKTPDKSAPLGWVAVAASILIFGSYGVLIKSPTVLQAGADPVVFQSYIAAGVACTSILVLTFTPWFFSWWGVLGAGMWWLLSVCSVVAIRICGYALGPAVWAGGTIVISFLWGSIMFHETVHSILGSVLAIVTLVSGIGLASYAATQSAHITEQHYDDYPPMPDSSKAPAGSYLSLKDSVHWADGSSMGSDDSESEYMQPSPANRPKFGQLLLGWLCVLGVAVLNGSLMVPFHYFNKQIKHDHPHTKNTAVAYLASFSVGIVALTPIFFTAWHLIQWKRPKLHFDAIALPAFFTGFFWASGNFGACFATLYIGQNTGFPLSQTCVIINGLYGILYYKEMTGTKAIGLFSVAVGLILGGAVMLTVWG